MEVSAVCVNEETIVLLCVVVLDLQ